MDKRPRLFVIAGGLADAGFSGGVCRRHGCSNESVELGFCRRCFDDYQKKVRRNATIHAVLTEEVAYTFELRGLEGNLRRAAASCLIDAIVGDDPIQVCAWGTR